MRILLFGVIMLSHWVMGPDNPVTVLFRSSEILNYTTAQNTEPTKIDDTLQE